MKPQEAAADLSLQRIALGACLAESRMSGSPDGVRVAHEGRRSAAAPASSSGQPVDSWGKGMLAHQVCRRFVRCLLALLLVGAGRTVLPASGQDIAVSIAEEVPGVKLLDPRSYGFQIPPGEVRVVADQRVLVEEGEQVVVAQVHARVGENYVLLMPDGRLVDCLASQVQSTDRAFEPLSTRELADRLRERFPGFQCLTTKNFVFVFNNPEGKQDGSYVHVSKRVLESMLEPLQKYFRRIGCETHPPRVPLVVVVFRTRAEFQAYRAMPPQLIAYYHVVSNEIVLHEETPLLAVRSDLATKQALSTIAHEGTHQILHNIGVQSRLSVWPMWLSEGLAEYLAPTQLNSQFRWKGAGEINDLRMFELESYIQRRYFTALDGETIRRMVENQQLDSTGYAAAWATTHYLAQKKSEAFADYLKLLQGMRPLNGMAARTGDPITENADHFRERFCDSYERFERELVAHLERQPYESPVAEYQHFVVLIEYPDGRKSLRRGGFFIRQQDAQQWLQDFLKQLDEPQRTAARFEVETYNNRGEATHRIAQWIN